MTAYSNLIRLTRPGNLLIVAITMMVVRLAVLGPMISSQPVIDGYMVGWMDFILLILVAVLLTAAGNIINDYFDQKVDKINRPDRVIVGKLVKRRVAIVLHQVFNVLAILITLYICRKTWFWWPLIIPVVVASLLWWYSPILKKRAFWGNLVVAFCTAIVPLWAGIFEMHELKERYTDMLRNQSFFKEGWIIIGSLSFFAFLLTLVREAQKDMEDIQGDSEGGYDTMPIRFGIPLTKRYVYCLITVYILSVVWFLYHLSQIPEGSLLVVVVTGLLLLIPTVMSLVKTISSESPADFHRASFYSKLMMIGGLVAFVMISMMLAG